MKPLLTACSKTARPLALTVLATLVGMLVLQPAIALGQQLQQTSGGRIIDRVLVRIGDRAILHSEFEAQIQDQLNVIAGQFPQEQIDAQLPMLRMGAMVGLVQGAILEIRADELGIESNANQVDRAINGLRESNGLTDDTQWEQALAQNGMDEAQLREQISGQLVQSMMMQQEVSRNVVTSMREAQTYYDDNPAQFTEPEQVLFQQIIFVFQGSDRAPVRQRAEDALAELRSGVSLTAVGAKYAQPAAGDVVQDATVSDWISPEDVRPEVSAAIGELSPLSYSDVVEGPFGYHIVQLMDRREGGLVPFEDVADNVRAMLNDQKMSSEMDEYIGRLVEDITIEIYAEEFTGLREALLQSLQGAPTGTPGQR